MEMSRTLPNHVETIPDEYISQGGVEGDEFPNTCWECKKMIRKYLCETTVLNNADMKNPKGNRNSSGPFDLSHEGQSKALRSCMRQCPPGEVNSYLGREAPSMFNQQPFPVVPYPPHFQPFSNNGGQGQFCQNGLYPFDRFLNDPNQGAPLMQRQYFQEGPQTNQDVSESLSAAIPWERNPSIWTNSSKTRLCRDEATSPSDTSEIYCMEGGAQTQKPTLANATSQTPSHDRDRGIQTLTPPGLHGGYQTANPTHSSECVQTPEAPRDLKLTQTGIPDESFATTQITNAYDNQMNNSALRYGLECDAARDTKMREETQRSSVVEAALALQQRPLEINSANDLATRTKSTAKPNDITAGDRNYASKNERMLAQQMLDSNRMAAPENPESNQFAAPQNPESNRFSAPQDPGSNMAATQDPGSNMAAPQNPESNRMAAPQNPESNRMAASQNPYPNQMPPQQHFDPNRTLAHQNENPDVNAQRNKNYSSYKNSIPKSQSSPRLSEEGFNQLPMSQVNLSPPAPLLPPPQLQDHRTPLRTVEAEPNKPLNAPNQGLDSQVLNYPHSRPPTSHPSIIINLTSTPYGPKYSCVPCCDGIQIWEQMPNPAYGTRQMAPIPNYRDFPVGVPYHTGGAQNFGNRQIVDAQFAGKSYGSPRHASTAENYPRKSTLEQNNFSSLEQDLLETSRKDQSDTSSSMVYETNEIHKRENMREVEDVTSNTPKNGGQTALVPTNRYPNPNFRNSWSSHPKGKKYQAIHSDFPPNPCSRASLLANGNDCNIRNQWCCPNANACMVEEKQLYLNRPQGIARKIKHNKVREPSCYPLRFENDRFKMDETAMDEAEFRNSRLRPKYGQKCTESICKCKGFGPARNPINPMRYILVEDEDQE
ncbi:unnamed protein product [Allacma fusca]|uniref:Uncharacterized protein n=1 Tax=Allacma fusca TaxID=39272 RepID=A0A8J2KE15_9HEXA|nr:unnamed protein product [Allacma fusca]